MAEAKNRYKFFRQIRNYNFCNKCVVFTHHCKSAKLTHYDMQLYHVIVRFLPNKHCFGPKMALFLPKISKKCINRDKSQYRDRMATACVQVQTFWRRTFVPSHRTTLRFNLALQLHFRGTLRNNLFCLNIFSTFPESCFHFSYLQKVLYPCYCYQLLEFVSSHVTMQIASVYICM